MMAANRLRACDSTVSWYDFTTSLSWSNKCEVAEVLSDIPFISVGILAFGVSVLFFAIKRVSLSAVLLFFSALLAFVAAVLDLGQTLADGMAMNTIFGASEHAVRAREVLFALSIGFRLMFYWTYVTERSRRDLSPSAIQRGQETRSSFFQCTESHDASWMHWGLSGKLVGAGSLIAIVVVTALQIVWRVVPQFRQYSNVYATDVALELLLSFFLLLKLLWDSVTFNSVDRTLVRTSSKYLAPISGLLVNIAIGVGDLLYFAFTESIVGRLLQAFEVYIIVVFVMVTAFLRHRDALLFTTSLQDKRRRGPVTTLPEFPRGSTFRITPPLIETPRMSTVFGTATQNRDSILRRSALSYISPWLSFRVPRRRARQKDEEIRFWDNEKVKANCRTGDTDAKLRVSIDGVATQTYNGEPERMDGPSANHVSNVTSDAQSLTAWSEEGSFVHSDHTLRASRADVPPRVRTSSVPVPSALSSISETKHTKNTVASSPEASPVYGLGGIQVPASACESRTSLNELLRQQSQLEQTIEALKLFSTETFTSDTSHPSHARYPGLARSLSTGTGQRTICSEAASLSNFPVPPELTTPVPSLPASASLFIKRIRGNRRVRLAAAQPTPVQDTGVLVPPKTLASLVDVPGSPCLDSMPHTPTGDNGSLSQEAAKSVYHESGETQYNVTSFIGGRTFTNPSKSTSNVAVIEDLATPRRSYQGEQEKPWWPTENSSGSGTIQTCSSMKPALHGLEEFSCSPVVANLRGDAPTCESADAMQYRMRCSPMALPQQISGADCRENDVPGIPIRRQSARGASSPTSVSAGEIDRTERVFVRRRPPPLDIQAYMEHKPGTWRVQVLADD